VEDKTSIPPVGYRYETPESIAGNQDKQTYLLEDDDIFYPADINSVNYPKRVINNNIPKNEEVRPVEKSKTERKKKAQGYQPMQVSTRINKGQNNNTFSKENFITYVSFITTQIAMHYILKTLKKALGRPNHEKWLAVYKAQLAKIEKKRTWVLTNLPPGLKTLLSK
jgi:hypothetical protein